MKIIILDAPDTGKGTQAKKVTVKYQIPHISTGDIFQANIKNGAELRMKAKSYMDAGGLVPDEITIGMLLSHIHEGDCKNEYVLDGFPRTIPQAESLTRALGDMDEAIDCTVSVGVLDENIINRMSGHRACLSCGAAYHVVYNPLKKKRICDVCSQQLVLRGDGKPETAKKRLDVYHDQAQPLMEYYKKADVLAEVDGTLNVEEVFQTIVRILGTWRMVTIKSEREIELTREAGRILAEIHKELGKTLTPGMFTKEIDRICENMIGSHRYVPSLLNYQGLPASVCISINDKMVHGIPDKHRYPKEGDTVSLDIGAIQKGYQSDAARTHMVGEVSGEARRLIKVTRQSFFEGVEYTKAGNHLDDISKTIQEYAESFGFGVIRDLVGHGVGAEMHEAPEIPNFAQRRKGIRLAVGMTLAIGPIITAGCYDIIWEDDGWTVVIGDGSLTSHYENTIPAMSGEPEILSL